MANKKRSRNMTGRRDTPTALPDTVVCTVVTSNYLHFALALAASVRRVHGELPVVICIADHAEDLLLPASDTITCVYGDQLGIPDWPRFSFQYSAFELSCALKPSVMQYCFTHFAAQRVVYLDADIQLYGTLSELDALTERAIILTPHLLGPLPVDDHLPCYETFLRAGVYNGGFLALHRSHTADQFLRWWESSLRTACVVRLEDGLFVDQRPLDLVPGLFDGVQILRRPGFHLAYWNLYGQSVQRSKDGYQLDSGAPVTLFHFSGLDPDDPCTLSKYQDRVHLTRHPVVRQMMKHYVAELDRCGRSQYAARSYGFATLSDGTLVRDIWPN